MWLTHYLRAGAWLLSKCKFTSAPQTVTKLQIHRSKMISGSCFLDILQFVGAQQGASKSVSFQAYGRVPSMLSFARNFGAKSGKLEPRNYLGQFFKRTNVVENICGILMDGTWGPGMIVALEKLDAHVSSYVLSEVLRSRIPMDKILSFWNWLKLRDKVDSYSCHVMLNRLGEDGRYDEMEAIVDELKAHGQVTVVTCTILIAWYKISGNIEGAFRIWKYMEEAGMKPNVQAYTAMIDLLAKEKRYEEAGEYYLQMVQERCFPNIRTCTVLMYYLIKAGKLNAAFMIFDEILQLNIKPNIATYSILMLGYAKAGDLGMILKLARQMRDYYHRLDPRGKLFSNLVEVLLNIGRNEDDILRVMEEIWPELPAEERKAVLELNRSKHVQQNNDREICGSLEVEENEEEAAAAADFKSMVVRWNMKAFVNGLDPWGPPAVNALQRANLEWSGPFVSSVLKRLRKVDVAWEFFGWVKNQPGFKHDVYTYARMIQMLLGARDIARVKQLLEEVQQGGVKLSLHTFNSIIKYCGIERDSDGAMKVFYLLKKLGLKANESTFLHLIRALAKAEQHWKAKFVFRRMVRAGFQPDVRIYTLLIDCFGKVGEVEIAQEFYRHMRESGLEPNQHTYKALMNAYVIAGNVVVVEQLFRRMKKTGLRSTPGINTLMAKVLRSIGRHVEAGWLEDEIKFMISPVTTQKLDAHHFLLFQKVFVRNLVPINNARSSAMS